MKLCVYMATYQLLFWEMPNLFLINKQVHVTCIGLNLITGIKKNLHACQAFIIFIFSSKDRVALCKRRKCRIHVHFIYLFYWSIVVSYNHMFKKNCLLVSYICNYVCTQTNEQAFKNPVGRNLLRKANAPIIVVISSSITRLLKHSIKVYFGYPLEQYRLPT